MRARIGPAVALLCAAAAWSCSEEKTARPPAGNEAAASFPAGGLAVFSSLQLHAAAAHSSATAGPILARMMSSRCQAAETPTAAVGPRRCDRVLRAGGCE